MTVSDDQIEKEFDLNNDKWLDMLVSIIKNDPIENMNMLEIAGNVAKHVE